MPRSSNSLSLTEFRILLREENFIDFFNKFSTLPIFGQLVTYAKDSQEFILDPCLPKNEYVLNRNGLLEWLWRKRFNYFQKCHLYNEYQLARHLLSHDFTSNDGRNFKDSDKRVLVDALHWLLQKCFGKVSALRRFRIFLRKTDQGYKMYRFWLDTEQLVLQIKNRASNPMRLFNKIKDRYFSGAGNLVLPQHLLDAAWRQMPESIQRGSGDNDKRVYDFTFAVYMQKLCKTRLCTYWVPRYVVSVAIKPKGAMEESYYSLALQYVRFRLAASGAGFDPKPTKTSGGGSKLEASLIPDVVVSSPDGSTERLMTAGSSRDSSTASQSKRKVKVSFAEHAPPGKSSEDEELEDWEKEAMKERQKRRKSKSGRRSRDRKRSPHDDRGFSDKPSTPPSGEDDIRGAEDPALGPGSSSDSVGSSESWEGIQYKVVKGRNEKQFKSKSRHRTRSLATRKQRFEQLLQSATDRRSSVSSETSAKAKAKGRRKSGQAIVDNVIDDIELGGTWETTTVQKPPDKESSSSRRDNSVMETMGGKALLKAALRLSGTASDDNEGFINSAPNSLWDVEVADDQVSKCSRRNSEASDLREELGGSLLLSRLSETRRSSRKGSTESFISTATTLVVKKRRPTVKNKPKKTKVTTLTFSLSGEGPTENVKNQTQKDEKPKKKEKNDKLKKTQHAKKMPRTIHKSIDKISNLVQLTDKTFSILEDHEYRSQSDNARVVLALQCDNAAARPFRQFLINTDNDEMVHHLSFWQHVECLRLDYSFGSMTFLRFVKGLKAIVSNFLLPTSPFRIESPPRLRTAIVTAIRSADFTEMPWQLRKLQMEVMEDLKYCYEAFAQQDVHSFITAAAFQTNNYVPNSNALQWHLGGQQQPTPLSVVVNKRIPDAAPLAPRLPGREELKPTALFDEEKIRKEMKQRMMRAHKLAIEGHLPTDRVPVPVAELSDDSDDSDVNGRMKSPTPPKSILLRPAVDMKELASRSLRQYPVKNRRQVNQMRLKKAERNPQAASFYRPTKRGAHYLKRPLTTPANFNEVLREQVHLEFFKRFLKAYRADTPFLFWIAVEALRTQENVKERQNKARVIIKRYFHNPKMEAVKMLQCTSDIIREIPYLDVVTTSMLYSAQTVVAKMLEDRWYRKYADTFTDSIFTSCMQEEVGTAHVKSNKLKRGHLRRAWTIFNDFIKRAAMFMRYMRNPRFMEMFSEFLKRAIEQDDIVRPVDDSLQSDVVANRSNNMPLIDLSRPVGDAEKDRKSLKQRIINGQLVTFDLLPNDLNFWREIKCYKTMSDCLSAKESIGGYSPADAELLKWKAKLIVNCYLDSSIAPPIRVNVPMEVAEITCESLQNGLVDRGLFHEATIYVFPVLLTFWKRFCDEHYKYFPVLSKKYKRIYGLKMTPAIAEAMKRQNEAKKQQAMARELSQQKTARLSTPDFPDYLHIDPRKFKKRRGSPHGEETCTRLTFSVSKGVTLVEPVRRKFNVMKNTSADVRMTLAGSLPQIGNKRAGVRTPGSRGGPRVAQRRTGLIDTNLLEQFSKLAK